MDPCVFFFWFGVLFLFCFFKVIKGRISRVDRPHIRTVGAWLWCWWINLGGGWYDFRVQSWLGCMMYECGGGGGGLIVSTNHIECVEHVLDGIFLKHACGHGFCGLAELRRNPQMMGSAALG